VVLLTACGCLSLGCFGAGGAEPGELLQPALWLNPYNGYTNTYQSVPGSNSAYNPVVFDGNGASISGDTNYYSYLGPRFRQQVPTGSTMTAVVEKDDSCANHYLAFSTSPNPGRFQWGSRSNRVVFVFNCDYKYLFSTSSYTGTYCATRGVSTWSLTITDTTVTWTDSNCRTLSYGMYPIRFQPAVVLRS